jgi:hypothetical protein
MDAPSTPEDPQPSATPPALPEAPPAWPRLWLNFFLVLNLFSGTATVLHAAFGNAFGIVFIASAGLLLHLIALLVVITAISCYRGSPWGHLILPLTAAIWSGHALLPLPAVMSLHTVEYASGLLEIASTVLCMLVLRVRTIPEGTNASFLFIPNDFCHFRFSLLKTLAATVAHFVILPAVYLIALAYGSVWMVNTASAGFIRINETGVFFQARTYRLNDKNIHLLPTVHLANPAFYKRVTSVIPSLSPDTTLVLPEGVTDRTGVLKNPLDYSGIAEATGLSAQPRSLPEKMGPRSLHIDADVSDFSPQVKDALNRFTRGMSKAIQQDLAGALEDLAAMDSNVQELFWKDILELRNQRVLSGIDAATGRSDATKLEGTIENIIVPWGAAHMPGIERGLLERKATLEQHHDIELVRWKKLADKLRALLPTE